VASGRRGVCVCVCGVEAVLFEDRCLAEHGQTHKPCMSSAHQHSPRLKLALQMRALASHPSPHTTHAQHTHTYHETCRGGEERLGCFGRKQHHLDPGSGLGASPTAADTAEVATAGHDKGSRWQDDADEKQEGSHGKCTCPPLKHDDAVFARRKDDEMRRWLWGRVPVVVKKRCTS